MRALLALGALLLALGSAGCCGCRHRHADRDEDEQKHNTALVLERAPRG